jgi:hypothetical protein
MVPTSGIAPSEGAATVSLATPLFAHIEIERIFFSTQNCQTQIQKRPNKSEKGTTSAHGLR